MAVNKKQEAKTSKSSKTTETAKKAAPAQKKTAPAKKSATKISEDMLPKKVAAKKTATPATAVVTKKTAPTKKAKPEKKLASKINQQTVNKKNIMPDTKATKTATVKKAAPEKKAAPAKKVIAETPIEAPVKKVAPAAKETAKPEPKPAPAKKEVVAKKTVAKAPVKQLPPKPAVPVVKPMPTPAARSTEKKPTVIIAHRKLENKSKPSKPEEDVILPYQPEVYRSILDDHTPEPVSTVYRYSDEELNEFKQLINTRLDAARKELNYLQGLITRKDEAGTEDTENRFMNMEDGSGAMEREQLAQLASRQIQFMNHLEKALVRIENKTYGVCRVTGKLIDKARLRAVPHATLSIEAKNTMSGK
jgi:RNA polymerase-binding transcription factor DksA